MITALTNCIIISNGSEIFGRAVLIKDTAILDVVNATSIPDDSTVIDLDGAYLAPGLIDLQIYGSGGQLFGGNPTVSALEQMETDLLRQGTTGFFATVATNTNEIVEHAIYSAKSYRKHSKGNFLGLHLEGPYLNPKRKGAHPEKYIKKAVLAEVKDWIVQAEGEIKMITIAPELQDREVVDYLNAQNIIISCGHSDASYEEATAFFDHISAVTHLFNAMPAIHHRQPGLIPAVFKKKPFASIVADGIHVNFAMIELAKQLLGDKLFLITDAVTEANEGVYPHVFTGDRYTMPDGTLSGSALSMLQAVKNCINEAGIQLSEAINMASLYPAKLIKSLNKGKVEASYSADLIAFDKNLQITKVWLNGEAVKF
ncbi:MAG TPA: N-acetylglucosamine-6-phosphate deacetylase [Sphingobacteriaceae bacterium]|nr:N-acetylglucosamine-6-phosphate deacetylase [Sphingobacteriaceae bacterium]